MNTNEQKIDDLSRMVDGARKRLKDQPQQADILRSYELQLARRPQREASQSSLREHAADGGVNSGAARSAVRYPSFAQAN